VTSKLNEFAEQYQKMLRAYLLHGGEGHLHDAYELGRHALGDELGLLDITCAHQMALLSILQETPHQNKLETLQ
jgi:hypothetical protein